MATVLAFVAAFLLPGFTLTNAGPYGGQVWTGPMPLTDRPGEIYLPPAFQPAHRYPVVYLLHGLPGAPSEFVSGTNFVSWADTEIGNGAVEPFIAVMPAAGSRQSYGGEWAGPWEHALVDGVVPFVDHTLPTIAAPRARILAGLSAGGYGALDIGLRHPDVFGTLESWSGYFTPLRDGPFKNASPKVLDANNPTLLAPREAGALARTRFFVSTGPYHSHLIKPAATLAFAFRLRRLGLHVALDVVRQKRGEWSDQLDAGLGWALASPASSTAPTTTPPNAAIRAAPSAPAGR